jgi:hypothetical protein
MFSLMEHLPDVQTNDSKASPSASKVFRAGGGIATFPASERTNRSRCKTSQAGNRLCFVVTQIARVWRYKNLN